jgi:hypothetical protein
MPARVNPAWIMNRTETFNVLCLSVFRFCITKFRSLTSKHLFIHTSRGFRRIRARQLGIPRKSYCAFVDGPHYDALQGPLNKAVYSPSNRKELSWLFLLPNGQGAIEIEYKQYFGDLGHIKSSTTTRPCNWWILLTFWNVFVASVTFNERYFVGRGEWGMTSPTLPSLHGKDRAALPGSHS